MKFSELLEKEEFSKIKSEIFAFAEEVQRDYINEIKRKIPCTENKEIFDAVWGPIELNPAEVVILDCPLLQRLRRIKQLGLASYVYCGADYSRFSHTVGVFYLADKMANIINKRAKSSDYYFVQLAKLAALFHDVGHMYFSHVSEYFFTECTTYKRFSEIKNAIVVFGKAIDKKVALHEMISVILVNAPSTKELLLAVEKYFDGIQIRQSKDIEILIEYISCMIVGIANDPNILPFHKIINGSVDADKCDYLSRDSHSTNVPVAVDIFRLIQKLNVEQNVMHNQKNKLWSEDTNSSGIYAIPTIKSSAEEALNQLLMARSIMFKSVYYHQKVRTAEVMLRNIFEELNELEVDEIINFKNILLSTDETFGYYCYSHLKREKDDIYNEKLNKVILKLNQINNRQLLKRASAISNENIDADTSNLLRFQKDVLQMSKIDVIKKIEEETRKKYIEICKCLKMDYKDDVEFMIVEFPKYHPDNSKLDTLISYGNRQIKRASEVFQAETWIGSKESRNKEHFLVTSCDNRGIAHLALQKVLYEQYNVKLNDIASTYSKVTLNDIYEYKTSLLHMGYYNSCLSLVVDIILNKYKDQIKRIKERYQTYEGEKGAVITEEGIRKYLHQFLTIELDEDSCYLLIDGVIKMLLNALFINRKVFDDGMEGIFKLIDEKENIYICPLGGEKDSSKHLLYYLNDIKDKKEIKIYSSLSEMLEKTSRDDQIVFFDDGAYSGNQVISIFQEYMGIEKKKRATNEEHVSELKQSEKADLLSRKIILAYICFNNDNKQKIEEGFKELGLNELTIFHAYDMKQKVFDEQSWVFNDKKQKDLVCEVYKKIGTEILKTAKSDENGFKERWSEKRVVEGGLGYNDAQQLVILKASVPTYTLTPLWLRGGKFNGHEWIPLFLRTDKVSS